MGQKVCRAPHLLSGQGRLPLAHPAVADNSTCCPATTFASRLGHLTKPTKWFSYYQGSEKSVSCRHIQHDGKAQQRQDSMMPQGNALLSRHKPTESNEQLKAQTKIWHGTAQLRGKKRNTKGPGKAAQKHSIHIHSNLNKYMNTININFIHWKGLQILSNRWSWA